MAETQRRVRRTIGAAQLLLVVSAGALWAASRLTWVTIRSFDELGPPKEVALSGATWSTALLPLALVNLAAAVAALAVRGWQLRALAALLAAASFAIGYLGVSLWAVPDVAARGAELTHIPVATLVGSGRQYWGAGISVAAAVGTQLAAMLLMRSASATASARTGSTKYLAPGARRSLARAIASSAKPGAAGRDHQASGPEADGSAAGDQQSRHDADQSPSERMIWDALDEGRDLTDRPDEPDSEGR